MPSHATQNTTSVQFLYNIDCIFFFGNPPEYHNTSNVIGTYIIDVNIKHINSIRPVDTRL